VASLIRGVEDLVVEHGEIEGKTEADGVSGRELGLSDLGGGLVGLERLIGRVLAGIANSKLGEVAVIVTLPVQRVSNAVSAGDYENSHLVVENLRLASLGRDDKVLV
jgi:hypothetical protein